MFNGVRLTLMIGPVVPIPVPQEVLDAVTDVQVTTTDGKASGFQLKFVLSNKSPLHTIFLLSGGAQIPLIRVVIVVSLKGMTEVLMDGVMTDHKITPGADPGHSVLTVTGEDLTRVMDYIDFSGFPFPAMPAEARVALMILKYTPIFGLIPMVIPSIMIDVPIPVQNIPQQKGTDLCYIKTLADKVGYVFYLDPGPVPGTSVAYWGPQIKVGVPQPALNAGMDAHTNIESIQFGFDSEHKVMPLLHYQNLASKISVIIPVPDVTPLSPPLGVIPPIPKRFPMIRETAKLSFIQAALIGLAKAAQSADAVTGTGSLDVVRYGRVLKARKLVGVRGVGPAFDGLYYVKSVTHKIKRGEYKQDFTLARNGLVSTLPRVPA
jgi:hypothetical protein